MYLRDQIIEEHELIQYEEAFHREKQNIFSHAVMDFDIELMKVLLIYGVDPNDSSESQFYSRNHGFLHSLAYQFINQKELKGALILQVAELLLEAGADPNHLGSCNKTPIQCTTPSKNDMFSMLLINYGARIEGNMPI